MTSEKISLGCGKKKGLNEYKVKKTWKDSSFGIYGRVLLRAVAN